MHIDQQYRFEGASDPDDESLVLALHDAESGPRGVLITAYGPSASASEAEVLAALAARALRRRRPLPAHSPDHHGRSGDQSCEGPTSNRGSSSSATRSASSSSG